MYILYPQYVTLKVNPERHVQAIAIRFRDRHELRGSVPAVIGLIHGDCLSRLTELVRQHISTFFDVIDGKVSVNEFTLTYCTGRIAWDTPANLSGTAESPCSVCSDIKL